MSLVAVVPERDVRFPDLKPSLTRQAALAEAHRCLYCFDAPCMGACPTHIDVPTFIRRIGDDNRMGAARTILDANVLGASCARACPVEVLCEGACVLNSFNDEPIQIGLLQRYAMEGLHDGALPLPFTPAPDCGLRVALIGAGPASLACAAELRRRGVAATIYDARPLPGGLNTYGIAEYKLPLGVSLHKVQMILDLGVRIESGVTVDRAMLARLESESDAIFLGMGLGAIHALGVEGEQLEGVIDALDLIAGYKSGGVAGGTSVTGGASSAGGMRRVAVVGAGNTAIDAAIAARRLGAEEVTLLYRRGPEQMSAFQSEYEHALAEGVRFAWYVQPVAITGVDRVQGIRLVQTQVTEDGSLAAVPESEFDLGVEGVVLAIGQATHTAFLEDVVAMQRGRVVVTAATGQTSHPLYFAGGDCTNGGREVVDAVAEGRRAGVAMCAQLLAESEDKHANA